MTSIRYADLLESVVDRLTVPEGTEDMTPLDAALAWAGAGFYVVPIAAQTKHAGSVLGKGWPDKTSRDPLQIRSWFARPSMGLAIHVGKSGCIAFDVDAPERLPLALREWLALAIAPFQSTREGQKMRGHHLFAAQPGRTYSNSTGRLGSTWGEVRGRNGIIVVAPTRHSKAADGGRYQWVITGDVPLLPMDLDGRLPKGDEQSCEAVDLSQVQGFLREHVDTACVDLLASRIGAMNRQIGRGSSRHDAARNTLTWVLRDAMAGLYPAEVAVERVLGEFLRHKPRDEWSSPSEFIDMVRWTVAQVAETSPDELLQIREAALASASPAIQKWMIR
jgi:hypothetical protein